MIIKQINERLAVKWLDNSYVDQCMALRTNNRTDVGGTAFAVNDFARHLLDKQYLPTVPSWACRAYGVIDVETNELFSFFLFKMLTSHRAWLVRLAISNQNTNNGLPLNGLGEALGECIKYAESLEYFQYFMVTPADKVPVHDRIWEKIAPGRDRYISLLEEKIPKNCVPGFPLYWDECMGRATLPFESAIRRVVMLPQHRKFKDAQVLD